MYKLSKRAEKNKKYEHLISLMKNHLKKDPVVKNYFEKYKVPIDTIDLVPIYFEDMEVSAKTVNKVIILNTKLLKTDITTIESYLVHELVHLNQQLTGKMKGKNKMEYLDKDTETSAFKEQIKFKKNKDGKEKAEEYTDDLLDYHNFNGKRRENKKKELMKEI